MQHGMQRLADRSIFERSDSTTNEGQMVVYGTEQMAEEQSGNFQIAAGPFGSPVGSANAQDFEYGDDSQFGTPQAESEHSPHIRERDQVFGEIEFYPQQATQVQTNPVQIQMVEREKSESAARMDLDW